MGNVQNASEIQYGRRSNRLSGENFKNSIREEVASNRKKVFLIFEDILYAAAAGFESANFDELRNQRLRSHGREKPGRRFSISRLHTLCFARLSTF